MKNVTESALKPAVLGEKQIDWAFLCGHRDVATGIFGIQGLAVYVDCAGVFL